jgi:chromosome segregation ATPase
MENSKLEISLQQDVSQLKSDANKQNKDLVTLGEQFRDSTSKISNLSNELSFLQERMKQINKDFIDSFSVYKEQNKKTTKRLRGRIDEIESKTSAVKEENRKTSIQLSGFGFALKAMEKESKDINQSVLGMQRRLDKTEDFETKLNNIEAELKRKQEADFLSLKNDLSAEKKATRQLYDVHSTRASRRSVGSGDARAKTAKPYDVAKGFLNNYLSIVFGQYV